jgi:murein DD-endopeptidase MepM/ murein hydrolase activator NlpD
MGDARTRRAAATAIVWLAVLSALVLASAADAMGSPRIAALQVGLRGKGLYAATIDGLWGPATERGVRRLQRRAGLAVDGIAGPRTRRALGRYGRPNLGRRLLRVGRVGWDVSQLQFLLAWHGFPSGTFDGAFGQRTRAAVLRFQRFARLGRDGIVGAGTLAALRHRIPHSPLLVRRPIAAGITDGFGPRGARFHAGVDFPAAYGTRVRAARRGRVVFAGWDRGGFGYLVVVRHGHGVYTWYAHLARVLVRRGQLVRRASAVGRLGATGYASGPHLHFEVHVRGAAVNPLSALR